MAPSILTVDQQQLLSQWNTSKRVVGVILCWKCPFFTLLEALNKPKDSALVGIIQEQIRHTTPQCVLDQFDLILWYKPDYSCYLSVLKDWTILDLPQVREMMREVCALVEPKKVKLLEMMEHTLNLVCEIRAELGIPGPRLEEINHVRDKALLKQLVSKEGIPTAKFMLLELSKVYPAAIDQAVEDVCTQFGTITPARPLFKKPVCGMGYGGASKIRSSSELKEWIGEEVAMNHKGTYLIEEYIEGREFWAIVALLSNGKWRPMYVVDFRIGDSLQKGTPVTFFSHRFEHAQEQFPNLEAFVGKCVEKIKPPHPHLFCVQGFQLEPNSDSYLFTECGYRLNGARGSGIGWGSSGISLETALISCHLDPNYKGDPDPKWTMPRFESQVWWPYKKGRLRSKNALPGNAPVTSEVDLRWYVEPGDSMHQACDFVHFIVRARIRNFHSEEQLRRDTAWVENNWKPDVQEEKVVDATSI